ncbi:MAG: sigma-70 family RNA polymerase sigma factor [Acidobacteriaceae bacterium]|nr:sigma-70 family RNA polymerase sigma factor [Acidobacteriaceae bacterium]
MSRNAVSTDRMAAFEATVLPHINAAYNLARWLTRNQQDAEDVVQESYLRALRAFDTFQAGRDGRAWLLAIVRNTCYTWLNKNRARDMYPLNAEDAQLTASTHLDPETQLMDKAAAERIRGAVADIGAEYREVLILREFEGLSYKEIAQIVGAPLGTVMSRLSRARKELQTRLCASAWQAKK